MQDLIFPIATGQSSPGQTGTYQARRSELHAYFDRTAVEAWKRLTSDAPVNWIRATVRAGREEMRATLLGWLPDDLRGARLLDAGCGTGALSVMAARRGARITAIDLSPTLIGLARERLPRDLGDGAIDFQVGDMLDPAAGHFDYVVAMDSLIHYRTEDVVGALGGLAARSACGVLFTFAPRTALLSVMHALGRLLPRGDRAPAIEPVRERRIARLIDTQLIGAQPGLASWRQARTHQVMTGFYKSQAKELVRG
jgi:magnesium-protoporphyrin O-methyltransferase